MIAFTYSTATSESMLRALGPYQVFTSGVQLSMTPTNVQWQLSSWGIIQEYQIENAVPFAVHDDWLDSSYATMLASEAVLAREWDTPEEDEAWANL